MTLLGIEHNVVPMIPKYLEATAKKISAIDTYNQCDQIGRFFTHFGQLFKACGTNYFAHTSGNFGTGVKIFHISSGIIFGQHL